MFLCCYLILVVLEICCLCHMMFFKFVKKKEDKEKWCYVGRVGQIYIHPLDGGPRLPLRRAMCTKCGFRDSRYRVADRTIIAYSQYNKSVILDRFGHLPNLDDFFRNLKIAANRFRRQTEQCTEFEIDYLGNIMQVIPFPRSYALANAMRSLTSEVQLCYIAPRKRRRFMKYIRLGFIAARGSRLLGQFLPCLRQYLLGIQNFVNFLTGESLGIFSNYSSFTVIDTTSHPNMQHYPSLDVPKITCNPQLVVDGHIPRNTTAMRIGCEKSKIIFWNFTPCNILQPVPQNEEIAQPAILFGFNMELKNRTLPRYIWHYLFNFGIRRERWCGGIVNVGDKVYVQRN